MVPAQSIPGAHPTGDRVRERGDSGTKVQPLLAEKKQCQHRRSSEGVTGGGMLWALLRHVKFRQESSGYFLE